MSDSPSSDPLPQVLLDRNPNINFIYICSLAMLVYEYSITFDFEVAFIWGSSWSWVKILFLMTRYIPFFDALLVLFYHVLPNASAQTCVNVFRPAGWLIVIGISVAEVIFSLRTWAIWGRNKWLGWFLPVFYATLWGTVYIVAGIALSSLNFDLQNVVKSGCLITRGDIDLISVVWGLFFVYDLGKFVVLMTLTLIPAFQTFRQDGIPHLMKVVLTDGIVFYIYLFVMALTNLVALRTLTPDYFDIVIPLARAVHSVLACRVVLHTREVAKTQVPTYGNVSTNFMAPWNVSGATNSSI